MSEEYTYSSGGSGCLGWLLLAIAGVAIFMLALPGDASSTRSESKNRSGLLSGNQTELLSRNQANIASTVTNCYGDYSCMTVISTTTSSESTTTSSTEVSGERNNVILSQWGQALCWDADLGTYTTSACEGVQP